MANDLQTGQIDISASLLRMGLLFLGSWAFSIGCAAILYYRPPRLQTGSFAELALMVGVPFFALCGLAAGAKFFRKGPVVSVGTTGIFDRRLTTDWIPWSAVVALHVAEIKHQRMLVLELDRDGELPLTVGARRRAKLNSAFGYRGYWIAATELDGGFDGLADAISVFFPPSDPGSEVSSGRSVSQQNARP